ncbi:MAG: Rieske (2Fe-2S) protein, partial [Arenicellales bacterium]
MSDWVLVARLDTLEVNTPVSADLDDERIMLARIDDQVVALEDLCTHDGAEISSG